MCKFIKVNCNKEFAHLHICTFVYLALTLTEILSVFFSVIIRCSAAALANCDPYPSEPVI